MERLDPLEKLMVHLSGSRAGRSGPMEAAGGSAAFGVTQIARLFRHNQ
jgi:hypothetical protein